MGYRTPNTRHGHWAGWLEYLRYCIERLRSGQEEGKGKARFPRFFHLILLPIPSPSLSVQEYSILQERRRLGHVTVAYEADLFTHPAPQTSCIQAADLALFSVPVLLSPPCALYTAHPPFSFSRLSQGCPCLRSSSQPPSSIRPCHPCPLQAFPLPELCKPQVLRGSEQGLWNQMDLSLKLLLMRLWVPYSTHLRRL